MALLIRKSFYSTKLPLPHPTSSTLPTTLNCHRYPPCPGTSLNLANSRGSWIGPPLVFSTLWPSSPWSRDFNPGSACWSLKILIVYCPNLRWVPLRRLPASSPTNTTQSNPYLAPDLYCSWSLQPFSIVPRDPTTFTSDYTSFDFPCFHSLSITLDSEALRVSTSRGVNRCNQCVKFQILASPLEFYPSPHRSWCCVHVSNSATLESKFSHGSLVYIRPSQGRLSSVHLPEHWGLSVWRFLVSISNLIPMLPQVATTPTVRWELCTHNRPRGDPDHFSITVGAASWILYSPVQSWNQLLLPTPSILALRLSQEGVSLHWNLSLYSSCRQPFRAWRSLTAPLVSVQSIYWIFELDVAVHASSTSYAEGDSRPSTLQSLAPEHITLTSS